MKNIALYKCTATFSQELFQTIYKDYHYLLKE